MFMGISSAGGGCGDYAGALRVLERSSKTPTGKSRTAKEFGFPLGGHTRSVTWVREREDGAIAFRLYNTDVVAWHSTEEFEITNFGTITTSGFARRFTPDYVRLHYGVERRGMHGGANTIGYRSELGVHSLCQGDVVMFQPAENGYWLPDESTCDNISLPVGIDRKEIREIARRYHLRDFELWLSMAPMHLDAGGDPIQHSYWNLEECQEALEQRNFRKAAEHLPLVKDHGGWGTELKALPIATRHYSERVTMSSLTKLKLALWDAATVIEIATRKTWDRKEFDRGMARVRQLASVGVRTHNLGPS